MAQTSVSIRMDEDIEQSFASFCENVGMSMTAASCVFAKQAVRKQRIPFEVDADPFYPPANMEPSGTGTMPPRGIPSH